MISNPLTHKDNKERGTYIYKITFSNEVKYTYINTSPGVHDNVMYNVFKDYGAGLAVELDGGGLRIGTVVSEGFVHTHPSCSCHIGENFSNVDNNLTLLPGISTVYLGTPKGMLYAYEGQSKSQRTVSSSMPIATTVHPDSKTK